MNTRNISPVSTLKRTPDAVAYDKLPTSVRYVKTGVRVRWWKASKDNGQIHLGWKDVPDHLLLKPDFPEIKRILNR
jgi:hypothetical protein